MQEVQHKDFLNGNTLVTVADKGKVFEVTPAGEKVWVFASSEMETIKSRRGERTRRAPIYRMTRIGYDSVLLPDYLRKSKMKS